MNEVVPLGALGDWLAKPDERHKLESSWVNLRPDLYIRLQMCDHGTGFSGYKEGIVAEAFTDNVGKGEPLWSDDYEQRSKPDLTKHGLTVAEQELVHNAARSFAPQLPVW